MKEEEKLLKVNLSNEQEKESLKKITGYRLYFFRALYSIQKYQGKNKFCDILFAIIEFVQLMAFPLDKIFSKGWRDYWFGTVGNFFRFFQLYSLWKGNTPFYIISYIVTCLYIIFLVIFFIHTLTNSKQVAIKNKVIISCIASQLQFETILNIPFLRTLFGIFSCKDDNVEVATDIKCHSVTQITLIVFSIIFIIIFIFSIIIFHSTIFEFGVNRSKFKSAYTSSTVVILDIAKLLLIIFYQFVQEKTALAIITLIISLLLLFHFLGTQPFSSGFTMKLYTALYLFFLWTSILCLLSNFLEQAKFEGGIILYLLGFPLIIFAVFFKDWDFAFEKIFEFSTLSDPEGYKQLLKIEYFLRLEENLSEKIKTKQQKVLYSYINNYERNCIIDNCPLKQFMKIPLKVENFVEMKICLLQHGEVLYKNAISKHPYNAKLRISYGLFLFNKVNKKLKGVSEIMLLDKFNTNLEDSFLSYKAQRFLKDEETGELNLNEHDNQDTNFINSIAYKSILNSIKSLIGKITMNYIDFWTILAISDGNKTQNFLRMSKIGTRIRALSEELLEHIKKLETINIYDQETFKIYMQYLTEILTNTTQANSYNNKLSETDQNKHQYNEENLFDLNYKEMSKREDYKYIIINFSPMKFNSISNLSYSTCKSFGYTKEELIGRPYNMLLPEIFCHEQNKIFEEKIDDFKKKILLMKNVKVRSDSWIDGSFSKNKLKYLIPFRTRWTLVVSDDEVIYGIGNIISDNININQIEKEVIYVLTDKNLIIQGFTPNAPKFLSLYASNVNNNMNIIDFIRELDDEYITAMESNVEERESNFGLHGNQHSHKPKKNLRVEILKKNFFVKENMRKVIHWKVNEVIINKLLKGNKPSFTRLSITNPNDPKSKSSFVDFKRKVTGRKESTKKRKFSMASINSQDENDVKKFTNYNGASIENDKIKNSFIGDLNNLSNINNLYNLELGGTIDDKIIKNLYAKPVHHKFYLSVREAKIHEHRVGYIFKFEPPSNKNLESKVSTLKKMDLTILNAKDIGDYEKSDLSVVSFAGGEKKNNPVQPSPENPFGISVEGIDEYFKKMWLEKENQFTLDLSDMSYKQLSTGKEGKILFEKLRKEAVDKINKANQLMKGEEQEEEESSSSGSYESIEDENLSDSELSSKKKNDDFSSKDSKDLNLNLPERESKLSKKEHLSNDNINNNNNNLAPPTLKPKQSKMNLDQYVPKNTINNLNKTNTNNTQQHAKNNKNGEDDFYHVDVSKITYLVFNYQSGFVEMIKDQKQKISQVTNTINKEKENAGRSTKFFANTKIKEKKKGNVNKKIVNYDEEENAFSEKTLKLKEIQKALSSKEKQSTIINLCLFSFVIFAVAIGTSIMSILINYYLKDSAYTFYILIIKSIQLYTNILYEISFVKEMVIINNPIYNQNYFFYPKEEYYKYFADLVYEYYLDTAYILTNITNNLEILPEKEEKYLKNKEIQLYLIDPVTSTDEIYQYREYKVLAYSAFRELNAALYHISSLKIDEIFTYDDNVYYFVKNGMSNLITEASRQMKYLTDLFDHKTKSGKTLSICCCVIDVVVYVVGFVFFVHFYKKVEERKQSYLSVFYEISNNLIILSLSKCEKFLHKLQLQENSLAGKGQKFSLESSTIDDSVNDNDLQVSSMLKQNKEKQVTIVNQERKKGNLFLIKSIILVLILFFILLVWQLATYIYYYVRLVTYEDCIQYEFHTAEYASNYIFPFIGLREYVFDRENYFYGETINTYVTKTLQNFYVDLSSNATLKDKYQSHFSNEFRDFLDHLYTDKICQLVTEFNKTYPGNGFTNCSNFFYGTPDFGFYSVLAMYIEEIRSLKYQVDDLYVSGLSYNFSYNETYFQDPKGNYQRHKSQFNNTPEEYQKYESLNPAKIFSTDRHKMLLIVYRFIISEVLTLAINESYKTFENMFLETDEVSLIINIIFIVIVSLGFLLLWLPFVHRENETIFRTKNMLSIIPNEILINLPHINIMLGIEDKSI